MSEHKIRFDEKMPERVSTTQGWVYLKPPSLEQVKRLHALLPFGLRVAGDETSGLRYGIVIRNGDEELRFLKQQLVEASEVNAAIIQKANRILVALSLARFQVEAGEGLFWPLTYRRSKAKGVESGIAYIGRQNDQSLAGVESVNTAFDNDFSPGFTKAMSTFVETLKAQSRSTGITLQECIGLDVRRASQLGKLKIDFLVLDKEVFCLKYQIREDDPLWTMIRSEGIDTLIHMPSIPLVV